MKYQNKSFFVLGNTCMKIMINTIKEEKQCQLVCSIFQYFKYLFNAINTIVVLYTQKSV